ncbi:SDR family oxidoreductase [Saccharopolyspora sp. NPDC050642]|uniref:SDR family oxidoreductase n=1 Tax=Saccharopolyspora sp. NPDC050642 TaxID=3157099 RepID=UPI00340D9631
MSQPKFVLLTGASGVVGTALRPALAHHRVISLTHRAKIDSESVIGDVTQPFLGLDELTYQMLASNVDTVVHCAAKTDFGAGADAAHQLNVVGTKRVLEFAAAAQARVIYVSTAFVTRSKLTRSAQGLMSEGAARPENYLDSKLEAEELLRGSEVPVVIARPSVVVGDSVTGAMANFQGVHMVAAGILRSRFPLLPFATEELVDVIPQDLLAAGLRALVDADVRGGEYWLTAGPHALTSRRFVDQCVAVAEESGIDVTPPRLVSPDMVDRLIRPVLTDVLPPAARKQFDDLLAMAALFAGAESFPTSFGALPGDPAALTLPSAEWFESAFRTSVRFFAHTKRLVPAAAAGATV